MNDPNADSGRVYEALIDRSSTTVIYRDSLRGIWRVPIVGGTPIRLRADGEILREFQITADASTVLYRSPQTYNLRDDLFASATDGSGSWQVNSPLQFLGEQFRIRGCRCPIRIGERALGLAWCRGGVMQTALHNVRECVFGGVIKIEALVQFLQQLVGDKASNPQHRRRRKFRTANERRMPSRLIASLGNNMIERFFTDLGTLVGEKISDGVVVASFHNGVGYRRRHPYRQVHA